MCIPKFKMNEYEINSFAKQLCSDIRYVKSNNELGNLKTYISLSKKDNLSGYVLIDKGNKVKENYLPYGTKIDWYNTKVPYTVIFRRDGTPNPTGGTINIFNDDIKKEITIVPVSGRVLLKEGKYEE